jgi:hypothetical protein
LIVFKNSGYPSSELFRITFNTAFIGDQNLLKFSRFEISPESIQKDYEKFTENFQVDLEFEHGCVNEPPCKSYSTQIN